MANTVKRVLFVNSEMFPYLPESEIANIGRHLPQGIQERKKEIRAFMPRYGCINERKNQLHEVILIVNKIYLHSCCRNGCNLDNKRSVNIVDHNVHT